MTNHLRTLLLAAWVPLFTSCSYEQMSSPPDYAALPDLVSLCDVGEPLALANEGSYAAPNGDGRVLLSAQLLPEPLYRHLTLSRVTLEWEPDSGLSIEASGPNAQVLTDRIGRDHISCMPGAMVVALPDDRFYVWGSLGSKSRRLHLQVTSGGALIMRNDWKEKGLALMVWPLKFTGDSWARFPAAETPTWPGSEPRPRAQDGACPDLVGRYAGSGVIVRPDGSLTTVTALGLLSPAAQEEALTGPAVTGFEISRLGNGGVLITLAREEGASLERVVPASAFQCESGRWLARDEPDWMSGWMLLLGSGGARWADMYIWQDDLGALLVERTYRSRAAIMLIPTGVTLTDLLRFESGSQRPNL